MKEEKVNADFYDYKYRTGYGLMTPESHIVRINKHILEWEMHLKPGNLFDFGCGSGTHLKYFAELGYTPFGCDTSKTAIEQCKKLMPEHADNFFVIPPDHADVLSLVKGKRFRMFLSNQVLYFLTDEGIRDIVRQAFAMVEPGGAFLVTMVSYHSLYARHVIGRDGDFAIVEAKLPRLRKMSMNFKDDYELEPLFKPFRKLHVGSYGMEIREKEGPGHHWSYVGVRD